MAERKSTGIPFTTGTIKGRRGSRLALSWGAGNDSTTILAGRFVVLALDQCTGAADPAQVLWTALDLAVLFKVLPKLHGTQQELQDLLASLFVFATTTDYESATDCEAAYDGWMLERDTLKPAADSGHEPAYLPRSAAKLFRMADQLRRRGFTSFIE